MKRVVVVGGAGFIGRNALKPLQDKGYEIHVFDIKSLKKDFPDIMWHNVDIMNFDDVSRLFQEIRPNYLLNFAWVTKHKEYWNSLENVDCINAGFNMLQAFAENGGQRVVMSGSCAEYDWNLGVCSEIDTPINPDTFYGACKASMWQIMKSYAKNANLSCSWGRIFFTFGPYENPSRLVSSVIASLLQNKPAKCSHGLQIRDFLSTIEIGNAFVALLDSEVTGPVNIASGNPVSLRDVIFSIAKILDKEHLIELGAFSSNKSEAKVVVAKNDRLSNEVGWSSKRTLEQQLTQTINWWKETESFEK